MAARRLSPSRVAGIAAWTAASVTWGTAAVALANASPAIEPEAPVNELAPTTTTIQNDVPAAAPALPDSGIIVLRYTPVERPEPKVIVQTVTVPGSPSAPSAPPVRERSSGS